MWGPRRAKYEIRPKNPLGWLRFFDQKTGELVFAKRVMHPGSPGHHMFARGVALTEEPWERECNRRLDRWARDTGIEMEAKSRVRRVRSL